MRRPPRYCHHKRDRRGAGGFWYFTRRGYTRVRLPGLPWSPEFMKAYEAALDGKPLPIGAKDVEPGTIADVVAKYYSSAKFGAHKRSTKRVYRRTIEKIRERHGSRRLDTLETRHIRRLASEIKKPAMAKQFVCIFRILLDHGISCGMIDVNPAFSIRIATPKTRGFHSWTDEEVAQFEARHPLGSRERLALGRMLYTGQRRSDAVLMGPQHIRNGVLKIVQVKTGTELSIPVHPELAAIIETSNSGHMAFLMTAQGRPFTANGFGNWFREVCNEAGLAHCSSHGLRKAAAQRLADAGATAHEIMSITGHASISEVEKYTRAANQKRLAKSAQVKVIEAFPRTKGEQNA